MLYTARDESREHGSDKDNRRFCYFHHEVSPAVGVYLKMCL